MTIGAYLLILRRYWVAVVVSTLVGLGLAIAVTALTPTVYVATTTQFVRGVPGSSATAEYQAAQFATSRAKSYTALIGNPDLLTGVIDQLSLKMGPADLYSRLTTENPADTVLINVTARATTAAEAQAISVSAADNLAKLIIRLESAGATDGKSPIDVQTAVPAPLPTSPASPRPALNLAVGTLLGLALGSILALALNTRRSVRQRSQPRMLRARPPKPRATPTSRPTSTPVAAEAGERREHEPASANAALAAKAAPAPPEGDRSQALPVGPTGR